MNIFENNPKQLIIKEIPQLRRYARSLCPQVEDAEDLVQATLERALQKFHLWRSGSNMKAWLHTIMHNLRVNAVKKEAKNHSETRQGVDLDQIPDPTVAIALSPTLNDLETAMTRLSEKHREVLLLVGLEQFSYDEAARILGISNGTVMSRLHRARRQLHNMLYQTESSNVTLRRIK